MKTVYYNIICVIVAVLGFSACSDSNVSDLKLSGECLVKQISLDGYEGKMDLAARTITVRVPETYNRSAMKITGLALSDGASCSIRQGAVVNMEEGKSIRVTHGDLYLDWILTVVKDEARITRFVINNIYTGIINQESKTITVYVPAAVGLTGLVPTITFSNNASIEPLSGVATDFTKPVTYTITNNSAASRYTVTVVAIDKPSALFVGSASTMNDLDPEAGTACGWMLSNIPNSMYASFADIQAGTVDLSKCKVIWWHYHKDGGVDGHDAFVTHAPEAIKAVNQLRAYYESGGAFLLTRYAVNLPSFIGATGTDEWTTPNNCWGQNENEAELCGDPWTFNVYTGQNNHALYQGLITGTNAGSVYCTDAGYHTTNSTAQYHIGTDWGDYPDYAAWTSRTKARILGCGGDGSIVAWEYPASDTKGGILCIGSGCYDWYSYTYGEGYAENYHKNISIMTKNALKYLMK